MLIDRFIGQVWALYRCVVRVVRPTTFAVALVAGCLTACGADDAQERAQRVNIDGYNGSVMEPFVTPDDEYLVFNGSVAGGNPDLHWAKRDGGAFTYLGQLAVNSDAIESNGSVNGAGDLYFLSPRSFGRTGATIHQSALVGERAGLARLVSEIRSERPGQMYFDAAISVDGQTLLVTEGQFGTPDNPTGNGFPKAANLVLFELSEGEFVRGIDAAILARVNTVALEYAGELSSDGLRLYFTRADPANGVSPQIFWASRDSEDAPFSAAALVPGLGDYAESPTLGGKVGDSDTGKTGRDGSSLYFHRPAPRAGADQGPSFVLYRATI